MVDWNKFFNAFRGIPSVGMPGVHITASSRSTSTSSSPSTPNVSSLAEQSPAPETTVADVAEPTPTLTATEPEITHTPVAEPEPEISYFFTPRQTPLTAEEREAGIRAHRVRLGNVTSSFEAPINPAIDMPDRREPTEAELATHTDIPLLMPETRFYWCPGDQRRGLTVGYGTFFQESRRLIPEDQLLLPHLQILNLNTNEYIEGNQSRADVIHELFPNIGNDKKLKTKPYYIPIESADDMLYTRFNSKTTDLDRLLSNKGRRRVQPRSALVDWVASDLYYQGSLSSKTGIPDFAANDINKRKLPKPDPSNLRLTARRTCADLQDIINANPFPEGATEAERQEHARRLTEYCTAYAAHQMTRANPPEYYTKNHVQAHIKDLSSLATMDIARNYYGRELSAEEIRMCRENSAEIAERIFAAEYPRVGALQISMSHEDYVRNPNGHYRAPAHVMVFVRQANEEARRKQQEGEGPSVETAVAGTRSNEAQAPTQNAVNLSRRLRSSGERVDTRTTSAPSPSRSRQ
ncbi:MAG: hypothetical protein J6V53_04165 [Alphaproteobacteria bacterium]|nr:hypothetical protein [Alphaproteobacteria bacterium]